MMALYGRRSCISVPTIHILISQIEHQTHSLLTTLEPLVHARLFRPQIYYSTIIIASLILPMNRMPSIPILAFSLLAVQGLGQSYNLEAQQRL